MNGSIYKPIVLIDKPRGISSNKALTKIKGVIRSHLQCGNKDLPKIGHGGTLDPEATGLLVVGLTREGTRKLNDHINEDKVYECEIDLLKESETGDLEKFKQMEIGDIIVPNLDLVQSVITSKFVGKIKQTPPAYSALKIQGKKACDLARNGQEVVLSSREITIYAIDILDFKFPILKLRVHCSKGTYIRTLGQDIGKALELYGTLISLRRLKSGSHEILDAINLNDLKFSDLLLLPSEINQINQIN